MLINYYQNGEGCLHFVPFVISYKPAVEDFVSNNNNDAYFYADVAEAATCMCTDASVRNLSLPFFIGSLVVFLRLPCKCVTKIALSCLRLQLFRASK